MRPQTKLTSNIERKPNPAPGALKGHSFSFKPNYTFGVIKPSKTVGNWSPVSPSAQVYIRGEHGNPFDRGALVDLSLTAALSVRVPIYIDQINKKKRTNHGHRSKLEPANQLNGFM